MSTLFDLTGKVALITGGSRGLGLNMAEGLGEMGARVAITARKAGELEEARAHLEAKGIRVDTFPHDLSKHATIPALVEAVTGKVGAPDILVNNAGTTWAAPAETHPDDAWRKVMDLNLDGVFFLTREIGRTAMIPRKSGRIINISSIAGLMGNPPDMQTIAYNTSKTALIGFTRALAAEWGRYGITVNGVEPGNILTEAIQLHRSPEFIKSMEDAIPLGRLGSTRDVANAFLFLASDDASYITGMVMPVDGGLGMGH